MLDVNMSETQEKAGASENKKVEGSAEGAEEPSMEDILKSIRGVISGDDDAEGGAVGSEADDAEGGAADSEDDDDEILELTEMAEEESPTEEIKDDTAVKEGADSAAAESGDEDGEKSVLDNIDEALGEEAEEEVADVEAVEADVVEAGVAEADVVEADVAEAEAVEAEAVEAEAVDDVLEAKESGKDGESEKGSIDVGDSTSESERLLKEKVADESSETLRTLVANLPRTQIESPYTAGGITLEQLTIEAMRPFLAEWLNENLPIIVKQIVTKEIKKLIPEEDDK